MTIESVKQLVELRTREKEIGNGKNKPRRLVAAITQRLV